MVKAGTSSFPPHWKSVTYGNGGEVAATLGKLRYDITKLQCSDAALSPRVGVSRSRKRSGVRFI